MILKHIRRRSTDLTKRVIVLPIREQALVQSKQDPSYGGALQKAKDTLNNMMEVSGCAFLHLQGVRLQLTAQECRAS